MQDRDLKHIETEENFGFISAQGNTIVKDALTAAAQFTSLPFEKLQYFGYEMCENNVNWKDYVDTFLDLYHIEAYHPGLTGLVNSNKIENVYGDGFHVQAVGLKGLPADRAQAALKPLLDVYKEKIGDFKEEFGAIWITMYPNILVEIYDRYFVFSVVEPTGVESCNVHKYSFCDETLAQHPEVTQLYYNFLDEVEREDVDLMERISAGRRILYERGEEYVGPFHPTKEDGMDRFHKWVRQQLQM